MTCASQDLTIQKGKTFSRVLRWESSPLIYKPITGITQAAPAVVTATGHGIPDGWRAAIVSVGGMREINAAVPGKGKVPLSGEFHKATFIDTNSFSLNEVNSLDFTAYTSGGAVVYYTPVDLTGYTARMEIRDTELAATVLLALNTSPPGPDTRIVIDNAAKTITLTISATDTAAITFTAGVFDLELVSGTGVVTQLLKGNIIVQEEVTK